MLSVEVHLFYESPAISTSRLLTRKFKKKLLRLKASNLTIWFLDQSGRQNKCLPSENNLEISKWASQ